MKSELRTVASLASLYAIRMLGLFMVLPVLSVAGLAYESATPATLGLALGIYGLTQACFQIPLGLLSDFIGRKPVIFLGLVIFAVGSLVAAVSDSVHGLIIGRAMQGSGAIASTIMALVGDLTSEENRTKAMAAIGASIGLSFTVALIAGPALSALVGLEGIFYFTCLLSFAGMALLLWVVPTPHDAGRSHRDAGAIPSLITSTLAYPELARLNVGIFILHAVLTAMFVAVPTMIVNEMGIGIERHWQVYLPVLLVSFLVMVPIMILAEKKSWVKQAFTGAVVTLSAVFIAMSQGVDALFLPLIMIFFAAFNLLEAMLPSLVSKIAPAGAKGTAMGIYSTWQFLGAFVGGTMGGLVVSNYSLSLLFLICGIACTLWFVVAIFMRKPRALSNLCFAVSEGIENADLIEVEGVVDATFVVEDGLVYVKVDKRTLDTDALNNTIKQYAV